QVGDGTSEFVWSSDETHFAKPNGGRGTSIYEVSSGKRVRRLLDQRGGSESVGAWHPALNILAIGGTGRMIKISDPVTGVLLRDYMGHLDEVNALAWSPDGEILASGSRDGTVKFWDLVPIKESAVWQQESKNSSDLAWSPQGERFAVATRSSGRSAIVVWDSVSRKPVFQWEIPMSRDGPVSCSWSPDGRLIASVDAYNRVDLWDCETGAPVEWNRPEGTNGLRGNAAHIAWHPAGGLLAFGGFSDFLTVCDTSDGRQLASIPVRDLRGIAWHPAGTHLAAVFLDKLGIWETKNWGSETLQTISDGGVYSVDWSNDGKQLALATRTRIVVWDFAGSRSMMELEDHATKVLAVAWSPDGRRLASGGEDRTVRIWDAANGKQLMVLHGHEASVQALAWRPDGHAILSAGSDGIRLWDAGKAYEMEVERNTK
ncbi:MAG TPA: hypothetical protein DDZ88_07590, partial [Verrucomicrobiales bacterium]|nr:hypothetical protein [Verrucomicrobiales bacterium]